MHATQEDILDFASMLKGLADGQQDDLGQALTAISDFLEGLAPFYSLLIETATFRREQWYDSLDPENTVTDDAIRESSMAEREAMVAMFDKALAGLK